MTAAGTIRRLSLLVLSVSAAFAPTEHDGSVAPSSNVGLVVRDETAKLPWTHKDGSSSSTNPQAFRAQPVCPESFDYRYGVFCAAEDDNANVVRMPLVGTRHPQTGVRVPDHSALLQAPWERQFYTLCYYVKRRDLGLRPILGAPIKVYGVCPEDSTFQKHGVTPAPLAAALAGAVVPKSNSRSGSGSTSAVGAPGVAGYGGVQQAMDPNWNPDTAPTVACVRNKRSIKDRVRKWWEKRREKDRDDRDRKRDRDRDRDRDGRRGGRDDSPQSGGTTFIFCFGTTDCDGGGCYWPTCDGCGDVDFDCSGDCGGDCGGFDGGGCGGGCGSDIEPLIDPVTTYSGVTFSASLLDAHSKSLAHLVKGIRGTADGAGTVCQSIASRGQSLKYLGVAVDPEQSAYDQHHCVPDKAYDFRRGTKIEFALDLVGPLPEGSYLSWSAFGVPLSTSKP